MRSKEEKVVRQQNNSSPVDRAWHAISVAQVLAQVGTTPEGLAADEAERRLEQYGANQIQSQPGESVATLIWRQINNPLIWVLLGSGILAMLLGKSTDGFVVLAVVVINGCIGFVQEYRAGQAIAALSEMVPRMATVIRKGQTVALPAEQLVPGDIITLNAGDYVPADARVMYRRNFQVEEAALTGESLPVGKTSEPVAEQAVLGDRLCMTFGGTLVISGTATAVVVATGMATELGRISTMLDQAVDLQTPLTKRLAEISRYITIGILLLSLIILGIGLVRSMGQDLAIGVALRDTLVFAIALAVAAIPEGLPAVVTIALAIGVQRMAARKAIIRKLPAVETLGSTTVICTDKTGTLTSNAMTVTQVYTRQHHCQISGVGYNPHGDFLVNGESRANLPASVKTLLSCVVLCNDASLYQEEEGWQISGDPTEAALLVVAAKGGVQAKQVQQEKPRLDAIPFASDKQYMATLHEEGWIIVKGAPEVIIQRCLFSPEERGAWEQRVTDLGSRGMRVLAVAQTYQAGVHELEESLVGIKLEFVGLVAMIDPPRTEAIEAVKRCQHAGITVKMITGDHQQTARAIGAELGLGHGEDAVTGLDLASLAEERLARVAREVNVFARVAPEHKLALVKSLQAQGHIVAMTGDGVNDAPSLKQANIGVAMGITGSEVSKDAADIVLADDNFASIAAAVEEGRRVYDNLIKSLAFLLPTNLGLALILVYGILFFPFDAAEGELLLPMQPTQLLWINLIAAVALALPLAFEVMEPDSMQRPPRSPEAPLFNGFVIFRVIVVSLLMTAGTIAMFFFEYEQMLSQGLPLAVALAKAQTVAVTFVVLFQIFYMIHCRSLAERISTIGFFSNRTIFLGIVLVLLFQLLFIYLPLLQRIFGSVPLDSKDWLLSAVAAFLIFPFISLEKWIRARARHRADVVAKG